MVKLENVSKEQVQLDFKGAGGLYSKRLNAGSVLKLSEHQYTELLPVKDWDKIKVSMYRIVGSFPARIQLYNKTAKKIKVPFRRGTSQYATFIYPNSYIEVTEEEFSFIELLHKNLEVVYSDKEKRVYDVRSRKHA